MYKLAIFDFDGTLADSAQWMIQEMDPLCRRFALRPVSPAEIEILRGCDARQVLEHLKAPMWKLPFIARYLRRRFAAGADGITLYPGAKALLRRLACQGVVLGVVSSNSAANVQRVLGPEVAALIEHYECGVSLFGKAGRFRRLVRRAKVKPRDALCIGDETRDIEAARKAGLASGAVAWGFGAREILAARAPTWLFDTPDEVAERFAA